jgi:hypothetical protein
MGEMSDKNRRRSRSGGLGQVATVPTQTRPTPPPPRPSKTKPTPKPTNRQRREYHNRADTFMGHVDQVMNPGKIYRDPGTEGIGRDRVVPALSELALAGKRVIEDKMNAGKMKDGGPTKRKKSIDGIAQRGKTRAK